MADITLDIGGNTRQLDRDIQKTVNKVYSINLKTRGDQPLGRITGKVNEFTKSLDASNARVIAFGASAGLIYGLERAFSALVSSSIEVQKSLQDINVILNVSTSELQKFGGELFNIAKNTGQSFQDVAKAATEFSRQGLGVAETLKRTNEALILSRLSGLDAAKSVEALTAAVNSFASQAVTASEVVNKFANVDAAFAVSSADLAEAISRVGSSAAQSGVSLNELIAIVTSAQQTTARGGAVIGNSFKTIFTRLERGKVLDLLESLGISTTDSSGQLKSTIQLLQDLGRVYDTLGARQQAAVAEQVGGVFQINILKSALADLGKEYSIYNSALNVASGATDQAIKRNEELNKTYASQINALQENARQLAAASGERLLGPTIDRLVGGTNILLQGFTENDGQGVGAVLGKGILDGIGQFIAGPGLALIGGVLLKLFKDLGKFATGSVQQLLGLNTSAQQQKDLQQSINQILSKNPQLLELALKGEQGLNQAANSLLGNLQKQTVELQKQAAVAAQISKAFLSAGVRISGGVPIAPTGKPGKAGGFIPNFANAELLAAKEERYTAQRSFEVDNPVLGQVTVNNREKTNAVPVGGYPPGTFIVNPKQLGQVAGIPLEPIEKMKNKASGFIPNFARDIELSSLKGLKTAATRYGVLYPQGGTGTKSFSQPLNTLGGLRNQKKLVGSARITLPFRSIYPIDEKEINSVEDIFDKSTDTFLSAGMTNLARNIAETINAQSKGEIKAKENNVSAKNLPRSAKGEIFESAVKGATRNLKVSAKEGSQENFDFDPIGAYPTLAGLFGFSGGKNSAVEAKIGESAAKNIPNKVLNQNPAARQELIKSLGLDKSKRESKSLTNKESREYQQLKKQNPLLSKQEIFKKMGKASGFIPNFSALNNAISRERSAGVSSGRIYVAQDSRLAAAGYNPLGLGVFNTRDEPTAGARSAAIKSRGYAGGYIPNFAIEDNNVNDVSKSFGDIDSKVDNFGSSIGAVVTELGFLSFGLRGAGQEYKQSLKENTRSNVQSAKKITESAKQRLLAEKNLSKREPLRQKYLAAKTAEKKAARGTFGQKVDAAGNAGGFAVAFAAPIIAETIAKAIGEENATARRASAGVSALGQIASFAGTGAMFGPWGAAIGAATGALLTVPNFINEMFTDVPEFEKALKKSSESLSRTSEATQAFFTATAELQDAIRRNVGPEERKKYESRVAEALTRFNPEQRKRIEQAPTIEAAREAASKEVSIEEQGTRTKAALLEFQKTIENVSKRNSFRQYNQLSSLPAGVGNVAIPQPLQTDFRKTGFTGEELDSLSNSIISASKLAGKQGKELQQAFDIQIRSIAFSQPNLLTQKPNIFPRTIGQDFFNKNDLSEALINAAKSPLTLQPLLTQAGIDEKLQAPYLKGDKKSAQLIYALSKKLEQLSFQADETSASINRQSETDNEENAKKEKAKQVTEDLINGLQQYIENAQQAATVSREINAIYTKYANEQAFADTFSRPAETVSKIVGENAPLAQTFASRGDIGNILKTKLEEAININETVIGNITSALNEGFKEASKPLDMEGKSSEQIKDYNDKILEPLKGNIQTAFDNIQKILTGDLIGGGETNQKVILDKIEKELVQSKIDEKSREKILLQAKEEFKKGNNGIEKLKAESLVALKTLAKEQTQKILIAKISQAQNFAGGIEEYINPPKKGESTFDKAIEATKGLNKFQGQQADFAFDYKKGTNEFKYQYPEAERARQKQAPEYGRKALNLIGGLQNYFGYTPDASGKAYQAGVAGLKENLDQQVAEFEKIANNPKTPDIVRDEINKALKEVEGLGGTGNIAAIQVAKQTGSLTEEGFKKITGKFNDPVLETLRKQNPELASIKAAEMIISDDPTVKAINKTNSLLVDIKNNTDSDKQFEFVVPEVNNPKGNISVGVDNKKSTPITSFPGISSTGPVKSQSISDIEAETRRGRDRKNELQTILNGTQGILGPGLGLGSNSYINGIKQNPEEIMGIYEQTNVDKQRGIVDSISSLKDIKERNFSPGRELGQIKSDVSMATYDMDIKRKGLYEGDFGKLVDKQNLAQNPLLTFNPQQMTTRGAKQFDPILTQQSFTPQKSLFEQKPIQQSFTQQEASLNTNTTSLATLNGGIQSLNSTLSNFGANFGNLNNAPSLQQLNANQQAGAGQGNVNTTTNVPVNVFVTKPNSNDIATAVANAIQNAIPEIVNQVRALRGEKVPPTVKPTILTPQKVGTLP